MKKHSIYAAIIALYSLGVAHASVTIIGEGAVKARDKDQPALCRIDIETRDSDQTGSCSGTLVGPNEVATGAHCFKKDFNLNYADVRVSCGGRSMTVTSVALPPAHLWVDETRPISAFDYARVTTSESLTGFIPKASNADLYFKDDGSIQPDVHCWIAGFGNSKSSNFGTLYIADVSKQTLKYTAGMIVMTDPAGGALKTSVDHGDSGGSFYCQAPKHGVELVAVIVSYRAQEHRDRNRMENNFAPIWVQSI